MEKKLLLSFLLFLIFISFSCTDNDILSTSSNNVTNSNINADIYALDPNGNPFNGPISVKAVNPSAGCIQSNSSSGSIELLVPYYAYYNVSIDGTLNGDHYHGEWEGYLPNPFGGPSIYLYPSDEYFIPCSND